LNSDGTRYSVTLAEYTGEWNLLSWKPDSTGYFYYYHTFSGSETIPEYALFDVSDPLLPGTTFLSNGDWSKEDNICFYTASDNLLSLTFKKLYNGKTGDLIKAVNIPTFGKAMFGFNGNGDIYFANLDKTNFRRFNEATANTVVSELTIQVESAQSEIGTGTGKVTSSGISCINTSGTTLTDCDQAYSKAATVVLKATPDAGSSFTSWSGCDSENAAAKTCTVKMSSTDKTVTAIFEPTKRYTVTVTKDGNGDGTINSSQQGIEKNGINCDANDTDCSETYSENTTMTLTARAASDSKSKFIRWEGNTSCANTTAATCRIKKIAADATVTAIFGFPVMTVSNDPLGFDNATTTLTLTIANEGHGSLNTALKTGGTDKARFRIYKKGSNSQLSKLTVAEGGSQDIEVKFTPSAKSSYSATLTITSNDPDNKSVPIQLTGTK